MTPDDQRRLALAEATVRELLRLAAIAEADPRAIPMGNVFDRSSKEHGEWALAWQRAVAVEKASRT